MKPNSTSSIRLVLIFLLFTVLARGQENSRNNWIYATVKAEDATALQQLNPQSVTIYATVDGISAVKLTERAASDLHHKVLTHGPGYVYYATLEEAVQSIQVVTQLRNAQEALAAAAFTIDQGTQVNQALNLVDNLKIEATIKSLVAFGTRYHTTNAAVQSVNSIKNSWQTIAAGRSDVSVRLVNHSSTTMPSAVITIRGAQYPNEYVIIGGHIDSTNPSNNNNAPGADDDASGIATITEALRVLVAMGFKPARTIEIMAYAAEEVGLRGSNEIARDYKTRNVNVLAFTQFDMTNYKGSPLDIYFVEDSYTTPLLTSYLKQLLTTYNASGTHKITYGTSACNYGCSDHASWKAQGYTAAFPIEATFSASNPYIHTANDTYERSPVPQAQHAAKFTKLALEFLIEVAKADGPPPACGVPSGLTASSVTTTGATLSWSAAAQASSYEVNYRTGTGAWISATSTTTSATITGLTANTTYEYRVRAICNGTPGTFSATATFKTATTSITYCAAKGNSVVDEWIANVAIGSLTSTSGANAGYVDFTARVLSATAGSTLNVSLTPGFAGTKYNEYWKIWIDYNKDGDFTDAGEQVFDGLSPKSTVVTGSFTIPAAQAPVSTRMRVVMRYNAAPVSCGSFNYGEVEDYTVNITSSSAASAPIDEMVGLQFDLYPNPVINDVLQMHVRKGFVTKATVQIVSLDGTVNKKLTVEEASSQISVRELPSGQRYVIVVESGGHYWTSSFVKQ